MKMMDKIKYMVEYIKRVFFKIKDYDRLEDDYIRVLYHATDGRMSQSNYCVKQILSEIDDAQENYYRQLIKHELYNFIDKNPNIDDIKNFISKI